MPTHVPPGPLAGETQVDFVNNGQSAVQIFVGSPPPIVVPPTGAVTSYGLTPEEQEELAAKTDYVIPSATPGALDVTAD